MSAFKWIIGIALGAVGILGLAAVVKAAKAETSPPPVTPPVSPPLGTTKVWSSPQVCFGKGSGCSTTYAWIIEPTIYANKIRFQALNPDRNIHFNKVVISHANGEYIFDPYIQNNNVRCIYGTPVILDMPFFSGIYKIRIDGHVDRTTHPRGIGLIELFI